MSSLEDASDPLTLAAQDGNLKSMNKLLNSGVDLNQTTYGSGYILLWTIDHKLTDIVKRLIQMGCKTTVECEDSLVTILQEAIYSYGNDDPDMIIYLIDHGVPILNTYGEQQALLSLISKGQCDIVKTLIDLGLKTDGRGHRGKTALQLAVYSGNVDMVKILIRYGEDPNEPDYYGNISINFTINKNYRKIAELLLHAGANPHHIDKDNQTPLVRAKRLNKGDLAKLMEDYPKIRTLTRLCLSAIFQSKVEIPTYFPKLLLEWD
jgi:ankyrin repeat protein